MSRIQQLFKNKQQEILNIYFTAGFPQLNDTEKIILTLEQAGVDLIEIGMPYSDPLADGPTIQQSGSIALKNGMHLKLLFEQIKSARTKTDIPLILMGYFNQVMQYGVEAFMQACQDAGVDGLILPDMPLEVYEEAYKSYFEQYGLDSVFLITPQTTPERIHRVDQLSTGFIYMVSSFAITGSQSGISNTQVDYFERIAKMNLKNNRLIGFGISDHQSFQTACQYAQGAIIGSAFIRALEKSDNLENSITQFIHKIRNAEVEVG